MYIYICKYLSYHIILYFTLLYHIIFYYVMLCYAILCHIRLDYIILCYMVLKYIASSRRGPKDTRCFWGAREALLGGLGVLRGFGSTPRSVWEHSQL